MNIYDTKKTQELAEQRKEIESKQSQEEASDDVKSARDFLKSEGVLTKADLDTFQKQQTEDSNLRELLSNNPELQKMESAIREIGKANPKMAYEDIIVKHGFSSTDKLAEAKAANRSVKGSMTKTEKKEKSLSDMTQAEFAAWEKAQGVGKGTFS